MSRIVDDIMKIGNQEIPIKRLELEQALLRYYPENPRIYSLVYIDEVEPSQKEIEDKLHQMDHVKVLRHSIRANGGLIDPIIVRDSDFVVLEGNSRLAAYRLLAKEDIIKWGKISAILLPSTISDDLIFTLLGQYHIIGRKDWSPFEQAGYLWRRHKNYNVGVGSMAREMGMSEGEVNKLITVYDFMKEHDDVDHLHWSYYDEYLKSRFIKKRRDEIPEFDTRFAEMVKQGEIHAAIDVREKLQAIAKVPGQKGSKLILALVESKKDFDKCYFEAEKNGVTNSLYQILYKFRVKVSDPSIKKQLAEMEVNQQKKCIYELKKIEEYTKKVRSSQAANIDEIAE